jgi:CubicO group peptidase (beta-lactamase class C family)
MFGRRQGAFFLFVLCGCLGPPFAPALAEEQTLASRLDTLFNACDDPSAPGGFGAAVLKDGAVVFKKGYGDANTEHGAPLTTATPFDFASVAKQFTGLAVALLATQERLSLDDDIRKYLPEMHDFGEKITIRHLLHHTSGLRDWVALVKLSGRFDDDTIDRAFLRRLAFRQRELNFPPGEEHLYSNLGYFLLAEIVERVTGESYAKWMRAHVFEPLEMNDTFVVEEHDAVVIGKAYSYGVREGKEPRALRNGLVSPGSSSLVSTIDDMVRWMRNLETGVVGGDGALELMLTRGSTNQGKPIDYGFGISIYDYRGRRLYHHGGSWQGFLCEVQLFPEERFSYIFVANRDPAGCSVREDVYDLFLSDQPSNGRNEPEGEAQAEAEDLPSEGTEGRVPEYAPPVERLAGLTGRYCSDELQTCYEVALDGTSLILRHFQNGDVALVPRLPDEFTADRWWISDVSIDRDEAGRVAGLRISADNGRVRNLRLRRLADSAGF